MRVLVTGASGFIGSHIVSALLRAGHHPVCAVRSRAKSDGLLPGLNLVEAEFGRHDTSAKWQEILEKQEIDTVVNAAGIIRENRSANFDVIHTSGPAALFDACQAAGVKLVVQISALGADDGAASRFHLSKKAADDHLKQLAVDSVIVQPSIVYGPGEGSMTLFKTLAALPVLPLIGKGEQQVQPIRVDDLAAAIAALIAALADAQGTDAQPGESSQRKITIPAVSPRPVTFVRLLEILRSWLGLKPAMKIRLPVPLMKTIARAGDKLGRGPITSESLAMLQRGNTADPQPFITATGINPRTVKEALPPGGASAPERRYFRLVPLTPLLRISIAFIWLATGIISAFVYPLSESFDMLAKTGLPAETWAPVLYATSGFEILLGIATLLRFRVRAVCLIQIALILGFTVIISASLPEYWLQPFGPVTKNIPIIAATLILMVLDDS